MSHIVWRWQIPVESWAWDPPDGTFEGLGVPSSFVWNTPSTWSSARAAQTRGCVQPGSSCLRGRGMAAKGLLATREGGVLYTHTRSLQYVAQQKTTENSIRSITKAPMCLWPQGRSGWISPK